MNDRMTNNVLNINGIDCDLNFPQSFGWLDASGEPHLVELSSFLRQWADSEKYLTQQTSGSTGSPKLIRVLKQQMLNSAKLTIDFFGLQKDMTALLCMSTLFIGGRMMVIRALVAGMRLLVVRPEENPLAQLNQNIDFTAMVPFQFARAVKESHEKFEWIHKLILGGAPLTKALEHLAQQFTTEIWHTYGMSETLSHIALRRINGHDSSARFYPLPGIVLRIDNQSRLVIDAPALNQEVLITNDLAELHPDGSFEILGRADNVIVSAGHKIHPEQIEQQLSAIIDSPFIVSSIPDNDAGEMVILVIEDNYNPRELFELWRALDMKLDRKERPRRIVTLNKIPLTGSGKADRLAVKQLLANKL